MSITETFVNTLTSRSKPPSPAPILSVYYESVKSEIEATAYNYYRNNFNLERWIRQFDEDSFYQDVLKNEFVDEVLSYNKNPRILDIGFGSGKEMKLIRDFFPQVRYVGIDFSSSFVSLVRSHLEFTESTNRQINKRAKEP